MLSARKLIVFLGIIIYIILGIKWMHSYSLWDDEANTALLAQSVHDTGDTSAIRGHNIIAYRNGSELNENLKARYVSPLQYFYSAPFIDPTRPDPFLARAPFFALILLSLALIYRIILKLKLSTPILFSFTCLSLGLTSFLLFGIQSRYYALTFFFSLVFSELYIFKHPLKPFDFVRLGFISSLIFISNYLVGIAVVASFGVHYIVFRKPKINSAIPFLVPHFLISLPVFLIWNPIGKNVVSLKNTFLDKLTLMFRNLRDFNGGHLGSLILLIIGLLVFESSSRKRFKEYGILFFTYIMTISLFSPQPVQATIQADIRYLYPLMILSFAWTLDFFNSTFKRKPILFVGLLLIFGFSAIPYSGQFRFHFFELISELSGSKVDPYQDSAVLLKKHLPSKDVHPELMVSVDYATYPLMFLVPEFKYIQTNPSHPPEYLVAWCDSGLKSSLEATFGVNYELLESTPSSCKETFRPEVFLRGFGNNLFPGTIELYKLKQSGI